MTIVKICGIQDEQTLQLLQQEKVDYAGFVFAPSKRQVTPAQVQSLLTRVAGHPKLVGVFVNPDLTTLQETISVVPLDVIQLHGDETIGLIQEVRKFSSCHIWKAIRVKEKQQVQSLVEEYRPYVEAFLLDAYHPTQSGGTGERFSWSEIPFIHEIMRETPFFIAGGINQTNVDELIGTYGAKQIDISSGVETEGHKDPAKIRELLGRVREYETNNR